MSHCQPQMPSEHPPARRARLRARRGFAATVLASTPLALPWLPAGCLLAVLAPQIAAAASVVPLPQSNYVVHPACSAPAPGRASCLALGLQPITAAARARVHPLPTRGEARTGLAKASECAIDYGASCLTPENLRSVYFPGEQPQAPAGEPQTIALVDAYNDPSAEADLNVYATEFGLPACTKTNGCFKQTSETGSEASLPFPRTKSELEAFAKGTAHQREEAEEAEGWALEIATDVEIAHAVCRDCHILLVEADAPEYSELQSAEDTAALQANEVSNSWGGPESGADGEAFNHPGVAITAAAGDDGYLNWDQYATRNQPGSPYFQGASYPASSPHVISVGGTRLSLGAGGAWQSESAWNSQGAGGSGCSTSLPAPEWQRQVGDWSQVGCGEHRANADISADADPSTGVNVYDSVPYPYEEAGKRLSTVLHWTPIGGTSVASPIIASMVALAGGAHGVAYPARTLYSHLGSSLLHDVVSGGNGECNDEYLHCSGSISPLSPLDCGPGTWICNATTGYDGPTGVGTPNGIGVFAIGEAPATGGEEGEPSSKPVEEQGKSVGGGEGSSGGGTKEGGGSSEPNKGGGSGGTEGGSGGTEKGAGSSTTGSGGSGSNGNGAGGQPPSGSSSVGLVGSSGGGGGDTAGGARYPVRISALALTRNARAALRDSRITVAQLAFSFVVSRAVTVRATLRLRVREGGRAHWRVLPMTFAFAAVKGLNRRRLHGSGALSAGLYRLTLTSASGRARSIVIRLP